MRESREIWLIWAEVFVFYVFLTDFIYRAILDLQKKKNCTENTMNSHIPPPLTHGFLYY